MDPAIEANAEKVMMTTKRMDEAVANIVAVMQEIDKRDGKLMAQLRQRYSLPQTLSALADSVADHAASLRDFLTSLDGHVS